MYNIDNGRARVTCNLVETRDGFFYVWGYSLRLSDGTYTEVRNCMSRMCAVDAAWEAISEVDFPSN